MDSKLQAAENQQQGQQQHAGQPKGNPLAELNKIGGFGFVESVVDGIANMNPTRKARKEIFLNDSNKADERKELLQKINLWVNLLESNDSADKMAETCKAKAQAADQNLKLNLKNTLDAVRHLKQTTERSLNSTKIPNLIKLIT
jgi:Tfp pilus assembly major pilin PilA